MCGGKIVVHLQLIGVDPVVLFDGAGTLVVLCNFLQLGNLDNDLVQRRAAGFFQLAKLLGLAYPPLV